MKGTVYYKQFLDGERLAFTLLAHLLGDPKCRGYYPSFIELLKKKWGMSDGTAIRSVQLMCEMDLFIISGVNCIEFSPAVIDLFDGENGYYVAIDYISNIYLRQLDRLTNYVNPTVILVQLTFGSRSEDDLVTAIANRYDDYAPPRIREVIRAMLKEGAIVRRENGLLSLPLEEIKKIDEACHGE